MLRKAKSLVTFGQLFRCYTNNRPRDFVSFYNLRSLYLYSSDASHPFLVNYLVDSLGFSKEEAISTSTKVISRKTPKNPDSVLGFLIQTGLNQTQIKELVLKVPEVLYYDVNRTLKPKIHWLKELGLSVSELVNIVIRDKTIIGRGLDTHLKPRYDCLRTILGSNEDVLRVIKRSYWLLTFGGHKTMEGNILLMQKFGISNEQIRKLILRRPSYIAQNSSRVMELLHMMENDFGVPRASAMFVYGVDVLFSVNKSKLETKMKIYKSFGWSDTDVFMLFSKMPYCFNQSEARIEKGLSFFMKELGYKPAYLASHPAILAYSLEERVVPRLEVLKILDHKKLGKKKLTLYRALYISESKFVQDFVLPYKDHIPDLYESHVKTLSL